MKSVIKVVSLLLVLCCVVLALACCDNGSKGDGTIVGYWKYELFGLEFVYNFNADGTGSYNAMGVLMPFTYTTEENKLSILYDGDTESFDTTYELKGDVLNVVDSAGEDTLYNRISEAEGKKYFEETVVEENSEEEFVDVPKSEQIGTAGSNIPLKDNYDEAEHQIKVAMQDWLKEAYGEKVFDARIYVEKIYTAEDEDEVPALKEQELGPDEVAFEVKYELKPSEGVDVNEIMVANGEYDEESGWIKEKYNVGILRPSIVGEALYRITDMGTGW